MGYTTPRWVRLWLTFSTVVVLWDAGYCFMRPRSFRGGDLSWIWAPYNMVPYADVDWLYGWPALDAGDGFTNAQSLLNVVEAVLNVLAVALGDSPVAPVLALVTSVMTSSKTILYFLQEWYCGWCNVGHNSVWRFWTVWVATNGTWILVPTIAAFVLGAGIARALGGGSTTRYHLDHHAAPPSTKAVVPPSERARDQFPQPTGGAALPLTFHPKGLSTLVFGSNRLAASRALTLLEADAHVLVAADRSLADMPEEIRWRVENKQVQFERVTGGKDEWAKLLEAKGIVLVAVTDTLISSTPSTSLAAARALHDAATALRIPINVSDHRELSTFTFPSVHRFAGADGPSNLQVAVSTNGHGCRLAGRIRREITAKLGANVGAAVDNVGRLRARAKPTVSEDDSLTPLNKPVSQTGGEEHLRRMRWVHQMSEYYSYDQLAALTAAEMATVLESGEAPFPLPHHEGGVTAGKRGRILLVGSGPGHPSLLTVAARHALDNATLVLSDKLVPAEIIALIPKTTKLHIARKFPGNADGAQSELMELALAGAEAGETVVRLKQGDPFVYGRGGEEVLYFREHGYECTVVPGVSSALAGPLLMGIPVTQRGVADTFVMCTGAGRGGAQVTLPGYQKSKTLAILMGVARIERVLEALTSPDPGAMRDGAAYPRHLPIAIVERASSPDQRVIFSTLDNVVAAIQSVDQRPPGMILVGWAAMCLEGKGRMDILDGADERDVVDQWLGNERFKTREGLPADWSWFPTA